MHLCDYYKKDGMGRSGKIEAKNGFTQQINTLM